MEDNYLFLVHLELNLAKNKITKNWNVFWKGFGLPSIANLFWLCYVLLVHLELGPQISNMVYLKILNKI